jgi:hypothetical protein
MRNRTEHGLSWLTAISDAGSTPAASTILTILFTITYKNIIDLRTCESNLRHRRRDTSQLGQARCPPRTRHPLHPPREVCASELNWCSVVLLNAIGRWARLSSGPAFNHSIYLRNVAWIHLAYARTKRGDVGTTSPTSPDRQTPLPEQSTNRFALPQHHHHFTALENKHNHRWAEALRVCAEAARLPGKLASDGARQP